MNNRRNRSVAALVTSLALGVVSVAACSGGSHSGAAISGAPLPAPASSASSTVSASGGSITAPPSPSSSAPASPTGASIITPAGSALAAIGGATPLSTLEAQFKAAIKPTQPPTTIRNSDGSFTVSSLRFDVQQEGTYAGGINYTPNKTVVLMTCQSPAPATTIDATRAICSDLKYNGSDATTARAWLKAAGAKLPAGNTKTREVNADLNGLWWEIYHPDDEPTATVVTVSAVPNP